MFRSKIINHTFLSKNSKSTISSIQTSHQSNDVFDVTIYSINAISVLISLILSTLSERNFIEIDKRTKSPEYTSALLSQLTFWWINSLINTGYKKELKREQQKETEKT